MFYRIGTSREIGALHGKFHPAVISHLKHCIGILDESYGAHRDCLQEGGYMAIAEIADDIPYIREILNLDKHPCEWAKYLDRVYVSLLKNLFQYYIKCGEQDGR